MLIQIFQRVMLLSVVGSAVGSIWLILKPITRKRFSPKWQYYIWLTTLVTLVFPVSFSLPQNTSAQSLSQIAIQNVTNVHQSSVYLEEIELPNSSALPVEAIKSTFTPTTQKTIHWLSILWLLGVLLSLIYRLTKYILFRIALYRNSANNTECLDVPKRLRVRNTAMLDAPLLVGLVRPILYLTLEKIDEVNLKYILQHELTHLKRHDLAYKWFALFAESIHWFNPIVYLISKQINEECEISCDYEVTSALSQQEQSCYMGMILDMAASAKVRKYMLTTQMISDKRMLRNRFLMIRNRINPRKKIRVLSVFAAVSILGSAVFTGGVLANELFSSDYIISVRNENKELIFDNRPFMEDNIVYLPVLKHLS